MAFPLYGTVLVEVFDPPSDELPEPFRTDGRYRLGRLRSKNKKGCMVDFYQPHARPDLVPYDRVYHPRQCYRGPLLPLGENVQALVRLSKNDPLTWVSSTLLDNHISPCVDVMILGKLKVCVGFATSKATFPETKLNPNQSMAALQSSEIDGYYHFYNCPSDYYHFYYCPSEIKNMLFSLPRSGRKRMPVNPPSTENHFNRLPNDLLARVAKYLDIGNQKRLSRLNKTWNFVCNSPTVRKLLIIDAHCKHERALALIGLTIYKTLLPFVETILFDCTKFYEGDFVDGVEDLLSFVYKCIKARKFSLKSMIFLNANPFHLQAKALKETDDGQCGNMFGQECFSLTTEKIRFINCWLDRMLRVVRGLHDGFRIYFDDVEINMVGKRCFWRELADVMDKRCGSVASLSKEEVKEMPHVIGRKYANFSYLWNKTVELEIGQVNDDRDYGKLRPFTVMDLRETLRRAKEKMDIPDSDDDY